MAAAEPSSGRYQQLNELRAMVWGMGQEQALCPICIMDTSVQVGRLLQRYEKFQEQVDSVMSQQVVGKVARQLLGRSQDKKLLECIQAAVTQVQACKYL